MLTTTGGGNHCRSFRRHHPGEGTFLAHDPGAVRLGVRVSRWPVVTREQLLPVAIGLGDM